jgi:hypothetical protein
MQIASLVGLTSPCNRLAAARKITHGIAFDIRTARARQLDDDAQSLVEFLDPGLHFANVFPVGGDAVAAGLLSKAGAADGKPTEHRQ